MLTNKYAEFEYVGRIVHTELAIKQGESVNLLRRRHALDMQGRVWVLWWPYWMRALKALIAMFFPHRPCGLRRLAGMWGLNNRNVAASTEQILFQIVGTCSGGAVWKHFDNQIRIVRME